MGDEKKEDEQDKVRSENTLRSASKGLKNGFKWLMKAVASFVVAHGVASMLIASVLALLIFCLVGTALVNIDLEDSSETSADAVSAINDSEEAIFITSTDNRRLL